MIDAWVPHGTLNGSAHLCVHLRSHVASTERSIAYSHIDCIALGFPPMHFKVGWMIRWVGGELSSVKVDDRRLDHS